MHDHRPPEQKHATLIIALAMAAAGLVSVSLAYLGKWAGVREPIQVSRSAEAPPHDLTTRD